MQIEEFALERYFARWEFAARLLLSPSDCEALSQRELVDGMDPEVSGLWSSLKLSYTDSNGHPLLRQEIAGQSPGINAEQVLTCAPEEGVFIAMHALLKPADRVIVTAPGYQSLHAIARSIGCAVDFWPVQPEGGSWALDMDLLAKLLPGAKLLVVNFPHNPTGYLPARPLFARILEMAERAGARVFSDEMYRLLERDASARLDPVSSLLADAVSLGGLSKSCGLPGLRSGWLISRDKGFLQRCRVLKDYLTICAPAPAEILSIAALRRVNELSQRCLSLICENERLMRNFCARHPGLLRWYAPQAGSTIFPRWNGEGDANQLAERCLEREGLMVVPGAMFGGDARHFRVGLGRVDFPAALEAFESGMKQ